MYRVLRCGYRLVGQNLQTNCKTRMTKILLYLMLVLPITVLGQIENRWQPDSVYGNRNINKIFIYFNSPKDLSETVEFDSEGKRTRIIKYSASYSKKTRRNKRIDRISSYTYDLNNRLVKITDSIMHIKGSASINKRFFDYDSSGILIKSRYYKGKFEKPFSTTQHFQRPNREITTRENDSIIIYQKTKEFEKDFYVNRFYGFYLEPKLQRGIAVFENDTSSYQYSDYKYLQRFVDDKTIKNEFNSDGLLLSSKVKSVFMNDRTNEYQLTYKYYPNGLLKSIRGYVPRYFEYELYE